jgi:hypothetical protein
MIRLILMGTFVTLLSLVVITGFSNFATAEVDPSPRNESAELESIGKNEFSTSVETNIGPKNKMVLPGDFLYFIKVSLEKLQLTLSFKEEDKAELLIAFASERIGEADALLASGEEYLALELLQKAVDHLEASYDFIGYRRDAEENDPNENKATVQEGGEVNLKIKMKEKFIQNLMNLTLAMEKVQNEKAKVSLEWNLEKSLTKFGDILSSTKTVLSEKELNKERKAEMTSENKVQSINYNVTEDMKK